MPERLGTALARIRSLLSDPDVLVRAIAAGRRRGVEPPRWERVELRPVALKAGRFVQVVTSDGARPTTRNVAAGADLDATVASLLGEPFGTWHIETVDEIVQVRVTKRGEAQVHATHRPTPMAAAVAGHDRAAGHLLAPDDPLFTELGANASKRRQVDAFLRALDATMGEPAPAGPLQVVDLGCGNAYLTFAAYRYLSARGLDVRVTGVDVRDDQRVRNAKLAATLGWSDTVSFVAGTIADAPVAAADLVLALHACDTATDEALARAVGWQARWVLAAPCCHHDIAAQLRTGGGAPAPQDLLVRYGILRERFADVLTDSLRAALLRMNGYRVEVVEFIDSAHTPRNALIRAVRGGPAADADLASAYAELTRTWQVRPCLERLLTATG
jgi:SAM-dependent methyltransferase